VTNQLIFQRTFFPKTKLVFGDNGSLVFFEGEKYMLTNPYMERNGQRHATGWVWSYRNKKGDWRCLTDPDSPTPPHLRGSIGSFMLREAVSYGERVTGLKFELVGAPADLPDSYPIPEMWRNRWQQQSLPLET